MPDGPKSAGFPDAHRVGEALAWLSDFYARHCNGEWEHQHGMRIQTIDNPGWMIEIDLVGTSLNGVDFEAVNREGDNGDWYVISSRGGKLLGGGAPHRLGTLLCLMIDCMQRAEERHIGEDPT